MERGYSYDQLARPITRSIARQINTRNDTFSYTPRSELTAATLDTNNYAYCYDNIGNRKTVEEEAEEITYAANPLNQYTSITKEAEASFVPTYDASGNQTLLKTSTGIWTVVYNAANRPVSFTSQDGNTIVECGYDYMGRRYMKKVTISGTVTKHERYLYRSYLQIACLDLTQSSKMALWFITWDPSQPVATRPLAIRKDGTWYCYGNDLTKNITEMFDSTGNIVATYDYLPYGGVAASGATTQPFLWSSEFHDTELALVYYNYRHYNPTDGRWINRDPIGEKGGNNIYAYYGNTYLTDYLGYGKVTQYIDRDNSKIEKTTVWHEDTAKFIGVVRDRPLDPPRYLYEISYTNYEQTYYDVLLVEYVDKSILSCWDIATLGGTIISIVRNDKRAAIACAILGTVTDCFEEKESDKFKVLKVLEKLYEGEKKQTNTSTVLRSYPEKLK